MDESYRNRNTNGTQNRHAPRAVSRAADIRLPSHLYGGFPEFASLPKPFLDRAIHVAAQVRRTGGEAAVRRRLTPVVRIIEDLAKAGLRLDAYDRLVQDAGQFAVQAIRGYQAQHPIHRNTFDQWLMDRFGWATPAHQNHLDAWHMIHDPRVWTRRLRKRLYAGLREVARILGVTPMGEAYINGLMDKRRQEQERTLHQTRVQGADGFTTLWARAAHSPTRPQ